MLMLNSLVSAYPQSGYDLYKKLDYWDCKELLDIISSSKSDPEETLQEKENTLFNNCLDEKAYNKFRWLFLDEKYNLFDIYNKSKELLE